MDKMEQTPRPLQIHCNQILPTVDTRLLNDEDKIEGILEVSFSTNTTEIKDKNRLLYVICHRAVLRSPNPRTPTKFFFSKNPPWFLSVRVGKKTKRTAELKPKDKEVCWNEKLEFPVKSVDDEMSVALVRSDLAFDHILGVVYLDLSEILKKKAYQNCVFPLGVKKERALKLNSILAKDTTREKRSNSEYDDSNTSSPDLLQHLHPSSKFSHSLGSKKANSYEAITPKSSLERLSEDPKSPRNKKKDTSPTSSSDSSKKDKNLTGIRKSTRILFGKLTDHKPHVLTPVCATREQELQLYFGLPESNLIKSFDCFFYLCSSMGGDVDAKSEKMGRLYFTRTYLCLYAGVQDNTKMRYSDVLEFSTKKGVLYLRTVSRILALAKIHMLEEAVEILEKNFSAEESYSLHRAIQGEDRFKVEYLLSDPKMISDIGAFNEDGMLPIHAAFRACNSPVIMLMLDFFEKEKMDINIRDRYGLTPLHAACYWCSDGSADEVLFRLFALPGVDFGAETHDQATPLHIFMQHTRSTSSLELANLLLTHSSKISHLNKSGETPLHYAVLNKHVRLLMMEVCLDHGADVNVQSTYSGETPLHYAARLNRPDCISLLLGRGADCTIKSKTGVTPLDLADQVEARVCFDQFLELQKGLKVLGLQDHLAEFVRNELTVLDLLDLDETFLKDTLSLVGVELTPQLAQKIHDFKHNDDVLSKSALDSPDSSQQTLTLSFSMSNALYFANPKGLAEDLTLINANWQIQFSQLEFTRQIGSGASGKVFKGLFKGSPVAIKVLNALDNEENATKQFKREFHMLNLVRHKNVIQFYGALLEPRVCIVMSLCENGSLDQFLRSKQKLDWSFASVFAGQVAQAIAELHRTKPAIFHRDIKCQNILLDRNMNCKLADFGEAIFEQEAESVAGMAGTIGWSAPELFFGEHYTAKCDIFSFGISLWEICNRIASCEYALPFREFDFIKMDVQILTQSAENNLRPTLHREIPEDFTAIITRCWAKDPAARYTSSELQNLTSDKFGKALSNSLPSPKLLTRQNFSPMVTRGSPSLRGRNTKNLNLESPQLGKSLLFPRGMEDIDDSN